MLAEATAAVNANARDSSSDLEPEEWGDFLDCLLPHFRIGRMDGCVSCLLKYLFVAGNYRSEKNRINPLEEYWTDIHGFNGNEMVRLSTAFQNDDLAPTFSTLLEMDDEIVDEYLARPQVGDGARLIVDLIRDEDGPFWAMQRIVVSSEDDEEAMRHGRYKMYGLGRQISARRRKK